MLCNIGLIRLFHSFVLFQEKIVNFAFYLVDFGLWFSEIPEIVSENFPLGLVNLAGLPPRLRVFPDHLVPLLPLRPAVGLTPKILVLLECPTLDFSAQLTVDYPLVSSGTRSEVLGRN